MSEQPSRGLARRFALVLAFASLGACAPATSDPGEEDPGDIQVVDQRVSLLNQAYCTVKVAGVGNRDTETDYLPHVIACENGGADLQALKAQAIAARSVAYYSMASKGSICDGTGCQVYSCNNQPSAVHYQAVKETAQQYLSYGTMLTYGFYVAGDSQVGGPDCVDVGGATTHYVTYNDGKSGTSVKQTALGWVGPPGFGQNRGCMSQWGARCLESKQNRDYLGILRFYYGSDIGLTSAPGDCGVGAPPPPTPAAACGDGSCDSGSGEDCNTCSADCGACSSPQPAPQPQPGSGGECAASCGKQAPSGCWCDASCAQFGDCCGDGSSCSACGNCGGSGAPAAAKCGDGTCNGSETCGDCPADCGACPSGGGGTGGTGSGGSCSIASHKGNGENGETCSDPAESWRCVFIPSWGTWGSQVCRYGVWNTFNLDPKDCTACCGSYVSGCSAK